MCDPVLLEHASAIQRDRVFRYARRAGLLGNLVARARACGLQDEVFDGLAEGAWLYAAEHSRRIEWELAQLKPVLGTLGVPVVLLKGAAYLRLGLPSAQGRLVSDIDLMVPHDHLGAVEQVMRDTGYLAQKQDDYDQYYYREWMHELPPMAHAARGTIVDLHHNIAPPVSRLKINAQGLLQAAVPFPDDDFWMRLSDEDMVLHLCVHLFHDGEMHNGLRELFDLDSLLRHFAHDEAFWVRLLARAQEMALMRPLYYGLHFCRTLLATPVAAEVEAYLDVAAPLQPLRGVLQLAMQHALLPETRERLSWRKGVSEQILFLRSHWLRMPPRMLVRHLWTQYRRRGGLKTAEQAQDGKRA